MIKKFNSILLFFIYFTILVVNCQDVFVNYNVPKNYSTFDECGDWNIPCVSLEDAAKRAILQSTVISNQINITIVGNVDGTTSASLGNLYKFCGTLQIRSYNNVAVTIDGSSSTTPFINVEEDEVVSCSKQRKYLVRYLNFVNWEQTLAKININQETNLNSIDVSKSVGVSFMYVNLTSVSSISFIYPKNIEYEYNPAATITTFSSIFADKLKSSSTLFAPNSLTDNLPPIYIVGGTITFYSTAIKDSNFTTTPFIYNLGGLSRFSSGGKFYNNVFCAPFEISKRGGAFWSTMIFDNNKLSTLMHSTGVSNHSTNSLININSVTFNETNDFPSDICSIYQYSGFYFFNSLMVVNDSIGATMWISMSLTSSSNQIPFTVIDSTDFTFSNYNFDSGFDFNIINSDVYLNYPVGLSNSTIEGINSIIKYSFNEDHGIACACSNCHFYSVFDPFVEIQCPITPTPSTCMCSCPCASSSSSSSSFSSFSSSSSL
ncbi:hypothetical protein ACTFIU_004248 [Dictyostelium citrinum]